MTFLVTRNRFENLWARGILSAVEEIYTAVGEIYTAVGEVASAVERRCDSEILELGLRRFTEITHWDL